MNSLLFSKRYLFSKKSRNAINIITLITAAGFAVCTAAMIIILSALNGFVSLVVALYSTFDADIKITPKYGKVIHTSDAIFKEIKKMEGIVFYNEVLEENVLLKYNDKQTIATIKAVSNNFVEATHLDSMLVQGSMILEDTSGFCTLGSGLAGKLDVNIDNEFSPIEVYVPKREQFDPLNPESSFNSSPIYPSGIFGIQQEIDEKYILVPLKFARELLEYKDEASAIELLTSAGNNTGELINKIKNIAGENYIVESREEQHASLYKLMKIEKWVAFFILAFILLIVSFNLIGSLLMIVIEKKKDFSILNALGLPLRKIRNIIIGEGLLISIIGSIFGIIVSLAICLAQQHYSFIKLGGKGATFVVDSYPIVILINDIIITFTVAIFIGFLASIYPAIKALKIENIRGE
jgi:ABC-type lipoprotein release transport system permease subunit